MLFNSECLFKLGYISISWTKSTYHDLLYLSRRWFFANIGYLSSYMSHGVQMHNFFYFEQKKKKKKRTLHKTILFWLSYVFLIKNRNGTMVSDNHTKYLLVSQWFLLMHTKREEKRERVLLWYRVNLFSTFLVSDVIRDMMSISY